MLKLTWNNDIPGIYFGIGEIKRNISAGAFSFYNRDKDDVKEFLILRENTPKF